MAQALVIGLSPISQRNKLHREMLG